MFGSLGFPELVVIFTVALLVFGPRKLPEIGRSLGRSLNEFKRATNDLKRTWETEVTTEEEDLRRDLGAIDQEQQELDGIATEVPADEQDLGSAIDQEQQELDGIATEVPADEQDLGSAIDQEQQELDGIVRD